MSTNYPAANWIRDQAASDSGADTIKYFTRIIISHGKLPRPANFVNFCRSEIYLLRWLLGGKVLGCIFPCERASHNRVTRWVCGKKSPKMKPNTFVAKFYTRLFPVLKIGPTILATSVINKKTTHRKHSPKRRKFAQSVHTALIRLRKMNGQTFALNKILKEAKRDIGQFSYNSLSKKKKFRTT
jgi:hypothetical protein